MSERELTAEERAQVERLMWMATPYPDSWAGNESAQAALADSIAALVWENGNLRAERDEARQLAKDLADRLEDAPLGRVTLPWEQARGEAEAATPVVGLPTEQSVDSSPAPPGHPTNVDKRHILY